MSLKDLTNVDGKEVKVRHLIFTFSNALSFSRVPASILVIYLHQQSGLSVTGFIWGVIAYIALSDMLDGMAARWLNQVSELGKAMDPIADKLCAVILFAYTVYLGWIPVWFLAFGMVRDIAIIIGSLIIQHKRGKVAMSIMSGKIAVNILALYWASVFFFPSFSFAQSILMWSSVVTMTYSWWDYYRRFLKIYQGAAFN